MSNVTVEGFQATPDADTDVNVAIRSAPTISARSGSALLAGREFTRADATDRPKVAIVNEAFVRKFNLGARDALGRRTGARCGQQQGSSISRSSASCGTHAYDEVK